MTDLSATPVTSPAVERADPVHRPVNAYRVQLDAGFDLEAAGRLLTYLFRLGVTEAARSCASNLPFRCGRTSESHR
jgi:hypothetical protein